MAPRNIFSIPEIVRIILDPFGMPEKNITLERQRRATLVAAASCTKIVSSQSLDLLWRDMTSIVPLFKVIPSFGLSLGSYNFLNVIEPDHWLRFESYACRIRSLSAVTTSRETVHNFVYLRTAQQLCGRPLLPRLSFISTTRSLEFLPILLSPTLLGIEILENHSIPVAPLLHSIFNGCPAIQNFLYRGSVSEHSFHALKCASSLRRLTICQSDIDWSLPERFWSIQLESIASLDSLEELSLSICETSVFPPLADVQAFRALQSLTLEIPSPLALSFFQASRFDSLRTLILSLQITQRHQASLELWQEIVSIVGRWGSKLREISFFHLGQKDPYSGTPVTGISYLKPLLDNCRLQKLIVDNDLVSLWSDNDILHVTSVWPDLQVLRLLGYMKSYGRPVASIEALKCVAQGLPQLQRLEIPINLTHLSLGTPCTRASHNLEHLHVDGIITGRDLIPVAHHLHALFPTLSLTFPKSFAANDHRRNLKRLLYLCQNAH